MVFNCMAVSTGLLLDKKKNHFNYRKEKSQNNTLQISVDLVLHLNVNEESSQPAGLLPQ